MKRKSVFTTEILICARKYNIIDSENNIVVTKVNIPFMTEEGYFAAPLPEEMDYDSFKQYENCELHELVFSINKDEPTFVAGRIERVTVNGFYGRFYKDCIHRAQESSDFCYTIRSAKWIELLEARLWAYKYHARPSIYKCKITSLPDKNKHFKLVHSEDSSDELIGAIIMLGCYIAGVVVRMEDSGTKEMCCISAEVLLREMCQHKEYVEKAIEEGILEKEKDPEFIIHSGVLEIYQGDAETVIVPDGVHTIGRKAFYQNYTIRELYLPATVTSIEDCAFDSCLLLEKVHFSEGLKSIGISAFCLCRSLESALLPDSVVEIKRSAFRNCEKLETLKLPKNLEKIEPDTFSDCVSLKSIKIPESVKSIGGYAFQCCKKLSEIELPDSVEVETMAFDGTQWLKKYLRKNGVLILGDTILAVSEKLKEYEIPENVKSIGSFAFFNCNIERLYIPDTVTEIKGHAFTSSNIKYIKLPSNLNRIEEHTFSDCFQLEELTIPESVDAIGECALHNLPNCVITILNGAEDVKEIGDYSFGWSECWACVKEVRVYYGSEAMRAARLWNLPCTYLGGTPCKYTYVDEDFCCEGTTLVKYLGHKNVVEIPDSITAIGEYAFTNNYGKAKKIILPFSVKIIGVRAFSHCTSLEEINGEGITEIKDSAFFASVNLKTAYFPSLKRQAGNAFQRCDSLTQKGLIVPEDVIVKNVR